eukprot:9706716-Lingulodinium_polyedra.AAC.1
MARTTRTPRATRRSRRGRATAAPMPPTMTHDDRPGGRWRTAAGSPGCRRPLHRPFKTGATPAFLGRHQSA